MLIAISCSYVKFYLLFHPRQLAIAEKWLTKNPSSVEFDERLQYYHKTVDDISNMTDTRDQDCIRLHMGQLARSVIEHAKEWIKTLGKLLQESAKESLMSLHNMLDVSLFPVVITHKEPCANLILTMKTIISLAITL